MFGCWKGKKKSGGDGKSRKDGVEGKTTRKENDGEKRQDERKV